MPTRSSLLYRAAAALLAAALTATAVVGFRLEAGEDPIKDSLRRILQRQRIDEAAPAIPAPLSPGKLRLDPDPNSAGWIYIGDWRRQEIPRDKLTLWWVAEAKGLRAALWLVEGDGSLRAPAGEDMRYMEIQAGEVVDIYPGPASESLVFLVAPREEDLSALVEAAGDGHQSSEDLSTRSWLTNLHFQGAP